MADEQTGSNRSVGQKLKRSVETHVLVPLAVTVVSAATHYLIKKLPVLLEEKVLPRLREQADAEGVRAAVAETAAAVGEKVAGVVPDAETGDGGEKATARPKQRRTSDDEPQSSGDEREQERQRREERRGERKRAVQKA